MQSSQAPVAADSHLCVQERRRRGPFPGFQPAQLVCPLHSGIWTAALTDPGSVVALEERVVSPSLCPAPLQLCRGPEHGVDSWGGHPSATCEISEVWGFSCIQLLGHIKFSPLINTYFHGCVHERPQWGHSSGQWGLSQVKIGLWSPWPTSQGCSWGFVLLIQVFKILEVVLLTLTRECLRHVGCWVWAFSGAKQQCVSVT